MPDLIDSYLPRFDVREHHRISVRATAAVTYAALSTTDLGRSPLVGLLIALRTMPASIAGGLAGMRDLVRGRRAPTTLATLEQHGFTLLEARPPEEMVFGLEGQFWRADGGVCTPPSETFRSTAPAAGTARAVWNFRVIDRGRGVSLRSTETRVCCAGAGARRRFLRYWQLVGPGSGLIRRAMLRAIRNAAEGRR